METEIWKDIDGYEGRYQVSNFGRVRRLYQTVAPQIMNPFAGRKGYLWIKFRGNGKRRCFRIHRLVAEKFIPNPDNKPQVNHIDGNKQNNRADNLEWVTNAENQHHAAIMGLKRSGEDCPNAKLTAEQVLLIRENPDGLSLRQLAKKFGVDQTVIRNIRIGKKWKCVGGQIYEPKDRRVPDDVRQQIRREYVFKSREFGSYALAKKYGVDVHTILRIVHEGDDNTA